MQTWKLIILAIIIGSWLLELVVETLNCKSAQSAVPEELSDLYDQGKTARTRQYLLENTRLGLLQTTLFTGLMLVVIQAGTFELIHQVSVRLSENQILRGLIFFGIFGIASSILGLPFSLYKTFVIEERFGFNRTTLKTFIADRIKGGLVGLILGTPILALILWFFQTFELAWLWAWLLVVGFQLVMTVVAPILILPLFNKYEPLEDGPLKDAVTRYAEKENFTLKGIFKTDGSKRSSKANAFFIGFGKFRRIVLFDTLINGHSVSELVAVLAHEMGHFKKKHIPCLVAIGILTSGVMFYLISIILTKPEIYQAFGMSSGSTPIYAGLVFATILFEPLNLILSFAGNVLSRKFEYQADRYAADTVEGGAEYLITALKKMSSRA